MAPADILRETERPEASDPGPPPPLPSAPPVAQSFKDIAAQLMKTAPSAPPESEVREAREKATTAREAAAKGASDFAAAQKPEIEATMKAGEKFAAEAAERKPQAPQLSAPPSRGLRPFLVAGKDETPEATISKLLAATTAFAGMIGGGKAGARASLSAMTGALEGWHQGDKQRADRAFADWKAHTETMLEQWNTELKDYELWMKASGMPLEQRMRGLQLQAMNFGNEQLAAKLTSDNANAGFKEIQDRQAAAVGLQTDLAKIVGMHESAEAQRNLREDLAREALDIKRKALELKSSEFNTPATLAPETVEMLAQDAANGLPVPSLGMGKSGTMARNQVYERAAQIRKERGDAPGSHALDVMSFKANQVELNRVQGQRGITMAFAKTFDKALDVAVNLSERVDRSGSPVLNKWILAGRRASGDPDVAAFNAATESVAMEYSKVMSGQGQGDMASREHARELLSTALTPEQFRRVAKTLQTDTSKRQEGYEDQIAAIKSSVKGGAPTPPPGTPAADDPLGIRVKPK